MWIRDCVCLLFIMYVDGDGVWLLFIMYVDGGSCLALVYNVVISALSSFVIISLRKRVLVAFLIVFLLSCWVSLRSVVEV